MNADENLQEADKSGGQMTQMKTDNPQIRLWISKGQACMTPRRRHLPADHHDANLSGVLSALHLRSICVSVCVDLR
jgi:hypothetical protein